MGCDYLGNYILGVVLLISIHAPRVGCDKAEMTTIDQTRISIHAPRVGCDRSYGQIPPRGIYFNPRTPCGVRPRTTKRNLMMPRNFNPRTPCGVRQEKGCFVHQAGSISIHAPRVGCDGKAGAFPLQVHWISIHAPRVGCDRDGVVCHILKRISIHAPRVGCDLRCTG